jgi:hypothetical protein
MMFMKNNYMFLLLLMFVGGFVSCGGDSNREKKSDRTPLSDVKVPEVIDDYGTAGTHKVATPWREPDEEMTVLYHPVNISKEHPLPVVLFAPGWRSENHENYEALLKFIATHGYVAIFAKDDTGAYSAKHLIRYFKKVLAHPEVAPYIDQSRLGVVGFSSGGGHAFKILDTFSKEGWGKRGRFLLAIEPWFAFDMKKAEMQGLPSNTNVLFIQFGKGGENAASGTDPRIPLSEYYLLRSIDEKQRDYQIVENADHTYLLGKSSFASIEGVLKPLDALMEYTFSEVKRPEAHRVALEAGSRDPYAHGKGVQNVQSILSYHYRCDGKDSSGANRTLSHSDIDYCLMER